MKKTNAKKPKGDRKAQQPVMELLNTPLIVIVGAFNDKILRNPEWDANYLFEDCKPEEVAVNIKLNINDDNINTIVTCKGIELSLAGNRLQIKVPKIDDTGFSNIMDIVTRLSSFIPHTPVTAFGVNFQYQVILKRIDTTAIKGVLPDEEWKAVGCTLTRKTDYGEMTCLCKLNKETRNLNVSFNFHNSAKNLIEVKNWLMDGGAAKALETSRPLAESMRHIYEGAE